MNKSVWRPLGMCCAVALLAACGNRETKVALQKTKALEDQKQYQDANAVLLDALRAREAQIRPATAPTDPDEADALTKKVAADSEILKLEREQVAIYLHMERADMASAVYNDITTGNANDTVVIDLLRDQDSLIRTGAVRILGLAGKPGAISALAGATHDEDKDVRRAAVAALGTIKDPATVEPLIAALKDTYWFVRSEAAGALGDEHDARAIPPLLDAVADPDHSVESAAETAVLLLSRASGASADTFAGRLNDPNPKIIMISAVALALLKDSRAIPVLEKLANSSDLTTRLQAIKGLGETGDPSVIPTLRKTLLEPDVNMRGWSIIGLGNLKDQASLPALTAFAADPNQPASIRQAATAAAAHIAGQTPPSDATPGNP